MSQPGDMDACERDARELIRAYLSGHRGTAEAVLDRANLRDLASFLAGAYQEAVTGYARIIGTPEADIPAMIDELLRGVASPGQPAAVPDAGTRRREAHASALALIIEVIDRDEDDADAILRGCTHAETAQVAVNLAEYFVECCEPGDRAAMRARMVEQLQSGALNPPGADGG